MSRGTTPCIILQYLGNIRWRYEYTTRYNVCCFTVIENWFIECVQATLCNNFTLFLLCFLWAPTFGNILKLILMVNGHVKQRSTPSSLCTVQFFFQVKTPEKCKKKPSQHIANNIAKRHQLTLRVSKLLSMPAGFLVEFFARFVHAF